MDTGKLISQACEGPNSRDNSVIPTEVLIDTSQELRRRMDRKQVYDSLCPLLHLMIWR